MPVELPESPVQKSENSDSVSHPQEKEIAEVGSLESPTRMQPMFSNLGDDAVEGSISKPGESHGTNHVHETNEIETKEESKEERVQAVENVEIISSVQPEASDNTEKRDDTDTSVLHSVASEETNSTDQSYNEQPSSATPNESSEVVSDLVSHDNETTVKENERDHLANNIETDIKEQHLSSVKNMYDSNSIAELERVKREMKMMEAALQGAARQAQAKADEIAKFMNENEQLKALVEDLKVYIFFDTLLGSYFALILSFLIQSIDIKRKKRKNFLYADSSLLQYGQRKRSTQLLILLQ